MTPAALRSTSSLSGTYSRRRFLRDLALAGAAVTFGAFGCRRAPATSQTQAASAAAPRVAVVGAGMAGLNAAYKLQQVGLRARIFEGSDRVGGRMFTARDLLGDGLTTELGGEFIDSTHEEMLALMSEFGLERLDTQGPGAAKLKPETYFINGRHYTQEEAARAFVPIAKRILADYDALGDVVDYRTEGGGSALDRQSVAQYLDGLGVTGWMRELLDVAYVTEYGLDAGEQSALNFIFLIGTGDLEDPEAFALLGESDERYKVRGGNQQIVDELRKRLESQIERRHRLEAMRNRVDGFTLTFQAEGRVVEEDADVVVLAIPFTLLRDVKVQLELPPVKKRAIAELRYGNNAKVLVGFRSRPWQTLGYSGSTYRGVSTGVGQQLPAAGAVRRPDPVFRRQSGARRGRGVGGGGGGATDGGHRARVPGRHGAAQRQGVAIPLADVPVDERKLFLLQARPVDSNCRRGGRACGQSVLRGRAL
jgi:monoamine oxidase